MRDRRSFLSITTRSIAGGALMLLLPDRALRAASRRGAYLERAAFAMGTSVSISAFGTRREQLVEATTAAFDEVYRLERLLSVYRADSDIGRLNVSAGRGEVRVSPETWDVLALGKEYHSATGGVFDLTVEPLMRRFGFRNEADEEWVHDNAPAVIGDAHLRLAGGGTVALDDENVRVDTGGIAVGYAVDRMAAILRTFGIADALINHGGDIYAMGAPEESEGWSVVVPHPTRTGTDMMRLSLKDRALSTSSNERTVRYRGASRYGHIFDPRTGENPQVCISMSVLAATSVEADALSTAAFVSGDTDVLRARGCDVLAMYPKERIETSLR